MIAASVTEYRHLARRRLPLFLFDYVDGDSPAERTLSSKVSDIERIALRQRILRDVSQIDVGTKLTVDLPLPGSCYRDVRSGLDVVRILALGADGVLIARPRVYALGARGEAGLRHVFQLMETEMRVAMALAGVTAIEQLDRSNLAEDPAA